ncbi:NUDIX hydrolase [Derxia gummosa]|uniref:Phosphatase NudJ n=1 Tax=Derxia gummosa DSM 723 TaxID=1121388 RepID=A0A8B6X8B3_9BURK|nr:NUDIX hydrolase [Derxia gummosa]
MSVWKPNVTVAAVIRRDDRFLLVEEETSDGIRLNNPAGHLERGESLTEAVVREALEETAHDFVPTGLLGTYMSIGARGGEEVTWLRFAFTGELGAFHADRRLDDGILRTVWLTLDEVKAAEAEGRLRSPLIVRCLEDSLKRASLPLDAIYTHESVWRS